MFEKNSRNSKLDEFPDLPIGQTCRDHKYFPLKTKLPHVIQFGWLAQIEPRSAIHVSDPAPRYSYDADLGKKLLILLSERFVRRDHGPACLIRTKSQGCARPAAARRL